MGSRYIRHNPYTEFHIKKIRHVVKCHGGSVLCEEHEGNMNSALCQKIIKAIAILSHTAFFNFFAFLILFYHATDAKMQKIEPGPNFFMADESFEGSV